MTLFRHALYCVIVVVLCSPAALIGQVDGQPPAVATNDEPQRERTDRSTRVFKVDKMDAVSVGRVLEMLLEGDNGVVVPEVASNSLIVSAPPADLEKIARHIEMLGELVASSNGRFGEGDTLEESSRQFAAFPLKFVRADRVAQTVKEMYPGQDGVRIEADPASNLILVYGTQAEIDNIKEIVARLDDSATHSPSDGEQAERKQRVFMLKHPYDAKEIGRRFKAHFGVNARWTANFRHDRIEFFGTEEQVEAAAEMIAELDAREFKVFSLQRSDATEVSALLRTCFEIA